eukprot:CAMPEP_0176443192 /NCGR_PEP_ID=MMETSP0127-20121128/22273_1 /TAXON_ID=938130 /ORGANISM="Platyophrya macrostoma, Strain WH" /LENGTH=439 /DNA_ID=CAMNT_0017828367 /DNA_START=38 /DNA_END=1360 /DNA_ORIENTATION=-
MYIFGDLHYDPYYGTSKAVSANTLCNVSDAPTFGTVGCDTPPALLDSAINDIFTQASQDSDGIILMTGDFVRHKMVDFDDNSASNSAEKHSREYEIVGSITETIAATIEKYQQKYMSATNRTKRLPVVVHPNSAFALVDGNEDCVPHYDFYTSTEPTIHPALMRLTASFRNHSIFSDAQADQFGRCAFYSLTPPETNLVILAMNTIIYSKQHRPNTSTESDPCGQFAWLKAQLNLATAAQNRVMILGHIIPDATKWYPVYLDTFRSLMLNYADVISVQWFGHTHMFTFLTLSTKKAPPLFDVPAITPRDGNMPSYLKVTFTDQSQDGPLNQSQWIVGDMTERFLDVTTNPTVANWQTGMSFPSSFSQYLTSPVTTEQLYQYGLQMLEDKKSSTQWEQFEQFYYGGVVSTKMGKKDKAETLCKAITASLADYDKCKKEYK